MCVSFLEVGLCVSVSLVVSATFSDSIGYIFCVITFDDLCLCVDDLCRCVDDVFDSRLASSFVQN